MISDIIELGKKIYDTSNWREVHRLIVFVGRSILHYSAMERLLQYFQEDETRKKYLQNNPFPLEQVTRAFFYKGATFAERDTLIREHMRFLQEKLSTNYIVGLAANHSYEIWHMLDEDINLVAEIMIEAGQRKEGMLSIELNLHNEGKIEHVYQMMFWFNKDKHGDEALWIGAMQGPNMENARDIIKDITKRSHRYRTKNLILYITMAVARGFGVKHIYAVSNEGYYANNHVRRDRKLKTNFGEFWEEVGGQQTDDPRFYEIPLVEPRKTMEEVPTRKRATYRKRYAFQDNVDEQIATSLAKIMKS